VVCSEEDLVKNARKAATLRCAGRAKEGQMKAVESLGSR
jgi:hypothetical protein